MLEGRARVQEGLADVRACRDGAEWRVAAADALAHGQQVGHDVPVVDREGPAGAPEARDHLIDDEQHAVSVADLAHQREVVVRGHERAADRRHDGLRDERGHAARPDVQDLPLQVRRVSPRPASANGCPPACDSEFTTGMWGVSSSSGWYALRRSRLPPTVSVPRVAP